MIKEYYKYTDEIVIRKGYRCVEIVIIEKDINRWMSL